MIEYIPLQPVPNQSLTVRLNEQVYVIDINTRRERLYITVRIDGAVVARNRALLSFAPVEGFLMILDTAGTSDPSWQQLGERFQLFYWPPDDE